MSGESLGRDLGCLPFPVGDTLLIGETRHLHLYEARFLALFERAMKTHHGCMAAVTVVEDGNLLSVASICNVIRWRRKQVGVSVTLRCVGRARLVGVSQSLPYLSAVASELVDVPDGDAPYPKLSAEIHELHRQCRQLEAKI
ncbi:unnamed protein product, partial [Phaeothamnion confervicola]